MRCIAITLDNLRKLGALDERRKDPAYIDKILKEAEEYIMIKSFKNIGELVFKLINKG